MEKLIIALNQELLNSIHANDWKTHKSLVDPSDTCFEPEAVGYLVEGLDFHHYYFKLTGTEDTGRPLDQVSPEVTLQQCYAMHV